MFIPYALIGIAIFGIVYVALRARGIPRFAENPNRIIGAKILFSGVNGLDLDAKQLPDAVVSDYQDPHYRVVFEAPVDIGTRPSKEARISARHVGYPISRMRRSRFGVLAVNGQLDTGQFFRADVRRY
jgi:hypothetical protein